MKNIIANIVRGGGKPLSYLLVALFAFAGAETAQAGDPRFVWKGSATSPSNWGNKSCWWYHNGSSWRSSDPANPPDSYTYPVYFRNGYSIGGTAKSYVSGWDYVVTFAAKNVNKGNVLVDAGSSSAKPIVFSSTADDNGLNLSSSSKSLYIGLENADGYLKILRGTYSMYDLYLGPDSDAASYKGVLCLDATSERPVSFTTTHAFHVNNGAFYATNATVSIANRFRIGRQSGTTATVVKVGGAWTVGEQFRVAGESGTTGEFTMDGGTLEVTGRTFVGTNNGFTKGAFTLEDGEFTAKDNTYIPFGSSGTGEFSINGGTYLAKGSFVLGNGANSTGKVMLNGGVLETKGMTVGNASSSVLLSFNGGTVKATAAGTLVADGIPVTVDAGGAIINLDGKSVTFAPALAVTNSAAGNLTVTGGGSATFPAMGDLAGAFTIGENTTLHWFDQDGVVSNYTVAALNLASGATLYLDADATGCDALPATVTTTATTANPATVKLIVREMPESGRAFPLFAMDEADTNSCNIVAETPAGASLVVEKGYADGALTYAIIAKDYFWNGNETNWHDAGAWDVDSAASDWQNNNNAVFESANSTVAVTANVTAVKLDFRAGTTINLPDGEAAAIVVPQVVVSNGVTATVNAPTGGALTKEGAGTLTLGFSRTAQTTVAEGTLAMADGATVDPTRLTLGTDPMTPVTLDYGGGTLASDLSYVAAGMDATLANGTFGVSGSDLVVNGATVRFASNATAAGIKVLNVGTAANTVTTLYKEGGDWTTSDSMHIGKGANSTTRFYYRGGTLDLKYSYVGDNNSSAEALLDVSGGTIRQVLNYLVVGNYGQGVMTIRPGGTYEVTTGNGNMVVSYRKGSAGTLNVAGGTASLKDILYIGYDAETDHAAVNVTDGGVLTVNRILQRSASVNDNVVTIDGGTLRAYDNNTGFITANDKLYVKVGPNGAIIDNNGKSVTVQEDLMDAASGAGAVTNAGIGKITYSASLTGTGAMVCAGGETFFDAGVSSSRPVTVKDGATFTLRATATHTLAGLALEDGAILNIDSLTPGIVPFAAGTLTLPESGTATLKLNGGAVPSGRFAILSKAGIGVADVANLRPDVADGATIGYSVDGETLYLVVANPNEYIWTGEGDGMSFGDGLNWYGGNMPSAGAAVVIGTATNSTLDCNVSFAPSSITFPASSAEIEISGDASIAGIAAITNLSSASHTINVPVAFADKILVVQGAMAWDLRSNPSIRFAGGVTGTTFADGTARYLDGAFDLSTGADWVANTTGSDKYWGLSAGSWLTLPEATDTSELVLGDSNTAGGTFTTGVQRTSARLCCYNYGEYVVTNELVVVFPAEAVHYSGWDYLHNGKFKFEKMTLDGAFNSPFKFGNQSTGGAAGDQYFYIGNGGLCFADGASKNLRFETGGAKNNATVHIMPWHGDYTIHTKGAADPTDFTISTVTYFGTTDENGDACTVTDDGVINSYGSAAQIHFDGKGTFVANAVGTAACAATVEGSATLAINPGKKLTTGAMAVNSGATLKVAESGTVTLGGDLTLNDGACLGFNFTGRRDAMPQLALPSGKTPSFFSEGETTNITVKVSGMRPSSGMKTLTTCGGFTGVNVTLADGASEWVEENSLKVGDDGNIVLTVKPMGLVFFVQ